MINCPYLAQTMAEVFAKEVVRLCGVLQDPKIKIELEEHKVKDG